MVSHRQFSLSDLPSSLADSLSVSDLVNGESVVFDPDDRVVFASQIFRERYPFINFADASFKGLFWGAIQQNLVDPGSMRMPPQDYLVMAERMRKANDCYEFVKPYKNSDLLCHHRSCDGWSLQIRVALEEKHFFHTKPSTLSDVVRLHSDEGRLRAALDAIATGIAFVSSDGSIIWTNSAAKSLLDDEQSIFLKEAFALAVQASGRRRYLALAGPESQPILVAVEAITSAEVMVLLAPRLHDQSLNKVLREAVALTPVQAQIAALVATGIDTRTAASLLKREWTTVRFQLSRIFQKIAPLIDSSQTGLTHLACRFAAIAAPSRGLHHPPAKAGLNQERVNAYH